MAAATKSESSSAEEQSAVIKALRAEKIGMNVFLQAIPISTGVLAHHNPGPLNPALMYTLIFIVSIGVVTIVNGLFFQNVSRRLSNALELTGIALMLLCFFVYLSSHLPLRLAWFPILCFFVSVLPTAVALHRFPPPLLSAWINALKF